MFPIHHIKLTNPYTIVGRTLTPSLSTEDKAELSAVLRDEVIPWEMLLATANFHRCTPLWYVRLRDHKLLDIVPEDLRHYLSELHAANTMRNHKIRAELLQIVDRLNHAQIPVMLLKGAATFADDLYKDAGARLMNDLDLLIPESKVFSAKRLLVDKGYVEDRQDYLEVKKGRILSRGHHLTPLKLPGSPVKIELHYRILKGIAGQALTADHMWQKAINAKINGCPVKLPSPAERLLHTSIHATLTGKDFIRSHVPLADLAEFTVLADHHSSAIVRQRFWRQASQKTTSTELFVFTGLAQTIMQSDFWTSSTALRRFHIARVINNSQPIRKEDKGSSLIWPLLQRLYYYIALPKWVWRIITLTSENARKMGLASFIYKRITDRRNWQIASFDG